MDELVYAFHGLLWCAFLGRRPSAAPSRRARRKREAIRGLRACVGGTL